MSVGIQAFRQGLCGMSAEQEQRLHLREPRRAGGRTAPDRWSATLPQAKPEGFRAGGAE